MDKSGLGGVQVQVEYLQSKYSSDTNALLLIGVIGCVFWRKYLVWVRCVELHYHGQKKREPQLSDSPLNIADICYLKVI